MTELWGANAFSNSYLKMVYSIALDEDVIESNFHIADGESYSTRSKLRVEEENKKQISRSIPGDDEIKSQHISQRHAHRNFGHNPDDRKAKKKYACKVVWCWCNIFCPARDRDITVFERSQANKASTVSPPPSRH